MDFFRLPFSVTTDPFGRWQVKRVRKNEKSKKNGRGKEYGEIHVGCLRVVALPRLGWSSPFLSTSLPSGCAMADIFRWILWDR